MNYSMESLDLAINTLLPDIAVAREQGLLTNKPDLIKMVAWKAFIEKVHEDRRDFNKSVCYHVVWEAAQDLEKDGFMTFGTRELKDEIIIKLDTGDLL